MKKTPQEGPFDGRDWPAALPARVVSADRDPTVFGYRLYGDLLENYDFLHVMWLILTGELASPASRRLFEASMSCLAAVRVSEGPSHAGLLAKTCDARPGAVVATTAVVCAEEAQHVVDAHAAWLQVVRGETQTVPAIAKTTQSGPAAVHLRSVAKSAGVRAPWLARRITDRAAILGCLAVAGLVKPEQLVTAWVFGRLIGANAEAMASPSKQFRSYPVNLPPMSYEED